MIKKTIFLAVFIISSILTVKSQNLEKLKDDYIRTFNPEGYNAYKSGQSVKYQGLQMAKNLSNNLDNYGKLIKTMDAEVLLSDFNQQIQDINNLQAQYDKDSYSYGFQVGQDVVNSINNGDFNSALSGIFGALDANEEQKEAQRKLEAKKEALQKQRIDQMSQIYWKSVDYNNSVKDQYYKTAAYSEFIKDEKYYLTFVDNLDCFGETMRKNWSSSNSNWLINNCPIPKKNNQAGIENIYVSKDVYYSNIAERKFKYFQETNISHYRDAAIAFAAKAVKTKSSAKYFYQMGTYYDGYSTVLALSNYSVANYYNPKFLNAEQKQRLEELKKEAEKEIKYALETNNQDFINAFINAKLNKIVRVDNKSLLTYAISLDQPDAVQIILNKSLENKTQTDILKKTQKVIMLCAVENSPNTIKRFIELGVPTDFVIKKYTPITIANKTMSIVALDVLINNSTKKDYYINKYSNSLAYKAIPIINNLNTDIDNASLEFNKLSNDKDFSKLVNIIVSQYTDTLPNAYILLGNNDKAKEIINNNVRLKKIITTEFVKNVEKTKHSFAHVFIETELVTFDRIPLLSEIKETGDNKLLKKKVLDISISIKIEFLIGLVNRGIDRLSNQTSNDNIKATLDRLNKMKYDYEKDLKTNRYLSKQRKNEIDGIFFASCINDENTYSEQLYSYYKQNAITHISIEEKLNSMIEMIELMEKRDNKDYSKNKKYLKSLIEKIKQDPNLKIQIKEKTLPYYAQLAIGNDFPLDMESLNLIKPKTIKENPDKSIVYIAFLNSNTLLLKALDDKHELSLVKETNGVSFFEMMLSTYNDGGFYISDDFDFNKKINSYYPLEIYLDNWVRYSDIKLEELNKILKQYNIKDQQFTQEGGTYLHWYVNKLSLYSSLYLSVVYSNSFEDIDKTIKDNNGLTAYDLYKKNKKNIAIRGWKTSTKLKGQIKRLELILKY